MRPLAVLAVALMSATLPSQDPADLILHQGKIWTVDEDQPIAQAVAIKAGKFVAVGSDAEVMRHRGDRTKVIDLDGAFAVPGFNDTHVHAQSAARFLEFNIMQASSQDDFVAAVDATIQGLPENEWILGGLWGAYERWAEGSAGADAGAAFAPDMRLINQKTAKNPMFISKFDNSEYAVNTAALDTLKIDPDSTEINGVEFVRDDKGFTGVIRGPGAQRLFGGKVPRRFSHERRIKQTLNALREAAEHGVTSFSDMSDDQQLQIWRELHARGDLTVRVHFRYGLDRWRELAAKGIRVGSGDEWIRLGSLKGHIDGIMGTSSARFYQPYSNDPENRGRWRRLMVDEQGRFAEGKFLGHMLGADKSGLQMTVHAIGDEANALLLDYLEEIAKEHGKTPRRFRLVHAQVIAKEDFPRLGKLGVIAEVQPFHLSDDMRWMEQRIGTERCKGAYAFKSIRDSGAVLAFGSDWPGTSASSYPIDPMLGLFAAVTRQTTQGTPANGWFPDEKISIEEAIEAYTKAGAISSFEEDIKGTITEGKVGDIVVLSRDLLTCAPKDILTTEVLTTVIGGRVVYQK